MGRDGVTVSAGDGRRWACGSSKRSSHSRSGDWHEHWWHIWRDVRQVTLSVQSAVHSLAVLHDSVLVAAIAHELLPIDMGLDLITARLVLVQTHADTLKTLWAHVRSTLRVGTQCAPKGALLVDSEIVLRSLDGSSDGGIAARDWNVVYNLRTFVADHDFQINSVD